MRKIISVVLILSNVIMFSGCATYRVLPSLSTDYQDWKNKQSQENVIVAVRFLDKEEIGYLFQRAMYKFNVYPAFLVIDNQTGDTYEFERNMIKTPQHRPSEVSDFCESSGFRRAGIFALLYLVFFPVLVLAIPAGLNASSVNTRMRKDYSAKEIDFKDIGPYSKRSGFIYLTRTDNNGQLEFMLRNKNTQKDINFMFTESK